MSKIRIHKQNNEDTGGDTREQSFLVLKKDYFS